MNEKMCSTQEQIGVLTAKIKLEAEGQNSIISMFTYKPLRLKTSSREKFKADNLFGLCL